MVSLIVWLALALICAIACVLVVFTIRKPMYDLLKVNSYISPAAKFYMRSFYLIILLAVLAVLAAAQGPSAEQSHNFMQCVWWAASNFSSVLWSILLTIGGYALLLTILFAVLGRYRD